MNDHHHTDRNQATEDHWEFFAEAMDLTIEGHRLIAQEIIHEVRLLSRGVATRIRHVVDAVHGWRSAPPI